MARPTPKSTPKVQNTLDMSKTQPYTCDAEGCDNEIFMPAMKFRKVSRLIAGTSEDQLIPVQIFICTACGNVNSDFDIEE